MEHSMVATPVNKGGWEKLKETWREHPLYLEGKVELVPIEWVLRYSGTNASPTILNDDGTESTIQELAQDILQNGLIDPLIMRVGVKDRNFRLEAGNHKIHILHQNGIKMVPVAVQVKDYCGPQAEDLMTVATHNFHGNEEILVSSTEEEFKKPSDVFKSLIK